MIIHMSAWLSDHGYVTHPTNDEGVIWAIDRHYPGGFHQFAADYLRQRRPATSVLPNPHIDAPSGAHIDAP